LLSPHRADQSTGIRDMARQGVFDIPHSIPSS
jgi:hypothetical protein